MNLVSAIQNSLSDDLRKPKYRGHENPLTGHCYVASEALYHLMGGRKSDWVPHNIKHEGDQHWYLKNKSTGEIIDPTAGQFKTPVPYHLGRGKGFLTAEPSKRAAQLITKIQTTMAAKAFPAPNPISVVEPKLPPDHKILHADSRFTDPDPWTQTKYRRGGEQEFNDWKAPMPGADEHPDLYAIRKAVDNDSGSDADRAKWKSLNKKTSVVVGLRAHKNSPHNPMAVFLKYAVHRAENPELYTDKTEQEIREMDSEWLQHHQQGKARTKNGHITVDDLHTTLAKNPNYIKTLVATQAKLHKALMYHAGNHIVMHNGQPHLPLVRGYGVTADKLDIDHSLASYADNPNTSVSFGGNLFRWLVPLKNIWHSYDLGPKEATSTSFGNEDEYLVSPHPRIPADKDTQPVKEHVPRRHHSYNVGSPVGARRGLKALQDGFDAVNAAPDNSGAVWPEPKEADIDSYIHDSLLLHPDEDKSKAALELFKKYPYPVLKAIEHSQASKEAHGYLASPDMLRAVHGWSQQSTENKIASAQAQKYLVGWVPGEHQDPEMHMQNPRLLDRVGVRTIPFTAEQLKTLAQQEPHMHDRLAQHPNAPVDMKAGAVVNVLSGGSTLRPEDLNHISPHEIPQFMAHAHKALGAAKSPFTVNDIVHKMVDTNAKGENRSAVLDWYESQGGNATDLLRGHLGGQSDYSNRLLAKLPAKHVNALAKQMLQNPADPELARWYNGFVMNPALSDENFEALLGNDGLRDNAQAVHGSFGFMDQEKTLSYTRAKRMADHGLFRKEYLTYLDSMPLEDLVAQHKAGNYTARDTILDRIKTDPKALEALNSTFVPTYGFSGHVDRYRDVLTADHIRGHFKAAKDTSDKVKLARMLHDKQAFGPEDAAELKAHFHNTDDGDWASHLPHLMVNPLPHFDAADSLADTIGNARQLYHHGGTPASLDRMFEYQVPFKNAQFNASHLDKLTDAYISHFNEFKKDRLVTLGTWQTHIQQNLGKIWSHPSVSPETKHKIADHVAENNPDNSPQYHNHLSATAVGMHGNLPTAENLMVASKHIPTGTQKTLKELASAPPEPPEPPAGGEKFRDFIANKLGVTRPGRLVKSLMKGIGTALTVGGMMALGQMSPKLQAAFDKINPAQTQTVEAPKTDSAKWTPEGLHASLVPIAHLESSWGKNMNHAPNSKGDFHTAFGPVGFKPVTAHDEWTKTKKLKELYPGLEDPAVFLNKFKTDWKFHNLVASSHYLRLLHRHGTPERAAFAWRWGSTACGKATDEAVAKDSYVMRYRDLAASTGVKKTEDLTKMAIASIKPGPELNEPKVADNFDSGGASTYTLYDYSHVLPKHLKKDYKMVVGVHRGGWKAMARVYHKKDLERGVASHIGQVTAGIDRHTAEVDTAFVHDQHQSKGIGLAAYEALYAHLYHRLGIRSIGGDNHSTLAARVHQKLSSKHGLDYPYADHDAAEGRPYDRAFGAYDYRLR